jgi:LemA protein
MNRLTNTIVAGGLLLFAAFAVGGILTYWSSYNGLVVGRQEANRTSAQVQVVLQSQYDALPNLLETVRGAANFETKTLTAVIDARASATRPIKLASGGACSAVKDPASKVPVCQPDQLSSDPAAAQQLASAQAAMLAINVNALREAYPTLQANQNFQSLMASIEGYQARIRQERRNQQIAIRNYNIQTETAVSGWVAARSGFAPMPYFEASAEAVAGPPKMKFD